MEQFQPTVDQRIEAVFGPETLNETAQISKQIFETMKTHLAGVAIGEGNSTEQRKKAQEYLSAMRDFSNYLFAQETSTNLDPENAKVAIEGAVAALAPEITNDNVEGAKNLISKLQKRYNLTP
ncbi:TPA: hypothetical protein DCQ44_02430 [Candidatus Taylorbacteria bacterium]|nr:hypothetical protein [Candidatus Taylorbacteria bacterium]